MFDILHSTTASLDVDFPTQRSAVVPNAVELLGGASAKARAHALAEDIQQRGSRTARSYVIGPL